MKHRFLRSFFAFLSVTVVFVSFAVNIFAADRPAFFSSSHSYNDNYIFTGNTDILISLGVSSTYSVDYQGNYINSLDLSTSLNPSFSYDSVDEFNAAYSTDVIEANLFGTFEHNLVFSSFECSDNYFVSGFVSDHSWFGSGFYLESFTSDIGSFYIDSIKVSARDFYIYLDPNNDALTNPYYDDLYAESFIYLESDPVYDGAEGTIYYCLAGEEDSANNRQVYSYSYSANDTSSTLISTLPADQSFSGQYSEPTLIYVDYFELFIPLDHSAYYPLEEFSLSGFYFNYNMDYRNIDISSYEEPISPINPGIFRDYTGWIGTAVGGFLDLELVDGFSLGGILMVIIAFMITMWFLKVFAGG